MFIKGDLVEHPKRPAWGVGKIMKTAQSGNLLVRFEQAGDKLLHPEYASLKKIAAEDLMYMVIKETKKRNGRMTVSIRVIPIIK